MMLMLAELNWPCSSSQSMKYAVEISADQMTQAAARVAPGASAEPSPAPWPRTAAAYSSLNDLAH